MEVVEDNPAVGCRTLETDEDAVAIVFECDFGLHDVGLGRYVEEEVGTFHRVGDVEVVVFLDIAVARPVVDSLAVVVGGESLILRFRVAECHDVVDLGLELVGIEHCADSGAWALCPVVDVCTVVVVVVALECLAGDGEAALRHVADELIHVERSVVYLGVTAVECRGVAHDVLAVGTLTAKCRTRARSAPTREVVVEVGVDDEGRDVAAWLHILGDEVDDELSHLVFCTVDVFLGEGFVFISVAPCHVEVSQFASQLREVAVFECELLLIECAHDAWELSVVAD